MYREPEPSMRELSDGAGSIHDSMRQSSVVGSKSRASVSHISAGDGALQVNSLVTNTKRSTLA